MANSSILVVGSVAFDSIKTPAGEAERILGGSLNYFSIGASLFAPVKVVGVVGEDFPLEHIEWMKTRGIDTEGLLVTAGKTFFWKGEYDTQLNEAKTLKTDLNVFEKFNPQLNSNQKSCSHIFLANIDPTLQESVLDQAPHHQLVAMDSMNFWITGGKLPELKKVLRRVDILSINEGEARLLSGERDLRPAADAIRRMGPSVVMIKRGEIGAALFTQGGTFLIPACLVTHVKDPTGAGDTFAAGFMGYLARNSISRKLAQTNQDQWEAHLRQAMLYGCVLASFTIEDFGISRLKKLEVQEFEKRRVDFLRMLSIPNP